MPSTLKYSDRDGETFSVQFNPSHKWKYVKGMTPEEFVLIKWYVVMPLSGHTYHLRLTVVSLGQLRFTR